MQNGIATIEHSFVESEKTKHAATVRPSTCIQRHLSQRIKTDAHTKNLYANVKSSLICNGKKGTSSNDLQQVNS